MRARGGLPARFVAILLLVVACAGCSPVLRLLRPDADPNVAPAVREIDPIETRLQAADDASAHLMLSEIGRTNTPDPKLPVWRMVYRPFRPELKSVLLLAGVHGNETAGVECALQVADSLASARPDSAPYDMDIIPLLNPWGYVHDLAWAPGGVDIGTDFTSFDSHEARLMRRFLREKRYDLVVDLREDADAPGFSIWQYGLSDDSIARLVVERVRTAGYPIEDHAGFGPLRAKQGVVAAPMWGLTLLRISREMTLAGYVRGEGVSALVFTVVTPAGMPPGDRTAMHRIAVDTLLSGYALPKPNAEKETAP